MNDSPEALQAGRPFSKAEKIGALEALRDQGFWVRADHFTSQTCEKLRDAIDNYVDCKGSALTGRNLGDERIWAAEYIAPEIEGFKNDATIADIGAEFYQSKGATLFVMANRLVPKEGVVVRSGKEWHRDRLAPQFKAMVYLSDVGIENGPFRLFPNSQFDNPKWQTEFDCDSFDNSLTRWQDNEIDPFVAQNADQLRHITGPAGTLVIFDSSVIHGGTPLVSGRRYALTSYFYDPTVMKLSKARKKWARTAGPIVWPRAIGGQQ